MRENSPSCDHPIISDNFSVLAKCPTFFFQLSVQLHLYPQAFPNFKQS